MSSDFKEGTRAQGEDNKPKDTVQGLIHTLQRSKTRTCKQDICHTDKSKEINPEVLDLCEIDIFCYFVQLQSLSVQNRPVGLNVPDTACLDG